MSSLGSSWLHAQPVNLDGMLRHSARRSPQKPAVICGDAIPRLSCALASPSWPPYARKYATSARICVTSTLRCLGWTPWDRTVLRCLILPLTGSPPSCIPRRPKGVMHTHISLGRCWFDVVARPGPDGFVPGRNPVDAYPLHGEKVIAFVALRDGFAAGEEELIELARMRIADYKTPERILFLPVLPKGLTGKVQRRALKNIALSYLESELAVSA
jgi:acyl-CoA synthetase (AMP-forming)/AMP-acid ligase II